LIEEASQIALEAAHPVANTASSPKYRREMVRVLAKNAIQEALDRINNARVPEIVPDLPPVIT
jgi:CO/xanthine dehydrogenase FAD-binding subunit